jgi:rod shape-determining protein MreC
MRWIATHKILTFILAALVLIIILFVVSWRLSGVDGAVGSAAKTVTSLIQKPFAALSDTVIGKVEDAIYSDGVLAENKALREANEQLANELARERLNAEELAQLKDLARAFGVDDPVQDITLKAADVLSFEKSNKFNIFTIDIGSESGIERNNVVICGAGLVGRVLSSGTGWAKVVCITDENNNVSFEIHRGVSVYLGMCHGVGDGTITGNLLDEDGYAKEGDAVYTSGLGGIYPAGIRIGTVTDASFTKDSELMSVSIDPTVYFKGIKKVLVLV